MYLQPDGSLLRVGHYPNAVFDACYCGTGGVIERIDWDGNVVWHYIISDTLQVQSHDICYLPNGNILVDVWENISASVAAANGRKPAYTGIRMYSPKLIELKPIGTDSAEIVWQWRAWDHLIQDYSSSKTNFGVVTDHPELINLNYVNLFAEPAMGPDWTHMNAVVYNPALDQVMVSAHNFSEVWIIDHSTSTAQATTHNGGKYNKGGDLLYRWGNPAAYNRGTTANTKFFQQHNCTWVPSGPYKNQIMVFNNGYGRPGGSYYSTVDVFQPPVDSAGNYSITPGAAYEPTVLSFSYQSPTPTDFYSQYMGSAQFLPNNNLLICSGVPGIFFEVDLLTHTLWKYVNPIDNGISLVQGTKTMYNSVYKCIFYPYGYPGLAGHALDAGLPLETNPLPYTCTFDLDVKTTAPANNTADIFPNPANNSFTIRSKNLISIELTDITGKTLIHNDYRDISSAEINTAFLPGGVYILIINNAEYKRMVIQH